MSLPEGVEFNQDYVFWKPLSASNPKHTLEIKGQKYWYVLPEERDDKSDYYEDYLAYIKQGDKTQSLTLACQVTHQASREPVQSDHDTAAGHVWLFAGDRLDNISCGMHPKTGDREYFRDVMRSVSLLKKEIAGHSYPDALAAMRYYFGKKKLKLKELTSVVEDIADIIAKTSGLDGQQVKASILKSLANLKYASAAAEKIANMADADIQNAKDFEVIYKSVLEAVMASFDRIGESLLIAFNQLELARMAGAKAFELIAATKPRKGTFHKETANLGYDAAIEIPISELQYATLKADIEWAISGENRTPDYHLFAYNGGDNCVTSLTGKRGMISRIGIDVPELLEIKDSHEKFVESPTSIFKAMMSFLRKHNSGSLSEEIGEHSYDCTANDSTKIRVLQTVREQQTFPFIHKMASLLQDGWLGVLAEKSAPHKVANRA